MQLLPYFVTAIAAYLVGSIPTGFLVGRAKGVDVRTVGSGNIGATNAFRILGRAAGSLVLAVDAFKGYIACIMGAMLIAPAFPGDTSAGLPDRLRILAGVCAVLGHNYTCWLGFKGGKGIATSAGVLIALVPIGLLVALGTWLIVFFASRYVSLASISAAIILPFAVWIIRGDPALIGITGALSALAIYKHKGNIRRLLNGTENRFGSRSRHSSAIS